MKPLDRRSVKRLAEGLRAKFKARPRQAIPDMPPAVEPRSSYISETSAPPVSETSGPLSLRGPLTFACFVVLLLASIFVPKEARLAVSSAGLIGFAWWYFQCVLMPDLRLQWSKEEPAPPVPFSFREKFFAVVAVYLVLILILGAVIIPGVFEFLMFIMALAIFMLLGFRGLGWSYLVERLFENPDSSIGGKYVDVLEAIATSIGLWLGLTIGSVFLPDPYWKTMAFACGIWFGMLCLWRASPTFGHLHDITVNAASRAHLSYRARRQTSSPPPPKTDDL